jgi:phosphopantothenoylcysteine decarboxylase/phosphopantothenate--cysteine ligase
MRNKRILLGITGGIAAYKIATLIRLLKKQEAEVRCIMTPASSAFISPLVVATLSENPVSIEFWNKETGVWTNHVELALWADLMVIAPATANTVAKMANGSCDNLLLATYLSLKCPCIIAPAMDLDMYQHPSFKRNIETLQHDNVQVIAATFGALASGLEGQGRMEEPEQLLASIQSFFKQGLPKPKGKLLLTAGPTQEAIDPVRFISNHSTGKMGFAIAKEALLLGYEVCLICGPVSSEMQLAHPQLKRIDIRTAHELFEAVQANWAGTDIGIFTAAVADFRPIHVADQKIKKGADTTMTLHLEKNPDSLAWAAAHKTTQKVVGFALETNNSEQNALAKLEQKALDYIVLNEQQNGQSGFASETNKIVIFDSAKTRTEFPLLTKQETARLLLQHIAQ